MKLLRKEFIFFNLCLLAIQSEQCLMMIAGDEALKRLLACRGEDPYG